MKTIEYAILSNHVYRPSKVSQDGIKIYTLKSSVLSNFRPLPGVDWYRITDVDESLNPNHSQFYAAVYVKYVLGEARHAVIAYRGTKTLGNKLADALAWRSDILTDGLFDKQPPYALKAHAFFRKAKDYVRHHFPTAKITLTGHSLGGALAQWVVGAHAQPYFTTTFNAPGIGHMLDVHDNLKHWVTNINSRYGFINKVGKAFGAIHYHDVLEEETTAKKAWNEIAKAKSLEAQTIATPLNDLRLLDKISFEELLARNDFLSSWLPQHKLDNLIQAMR